MYNGWRNRDTWNANLWLINDELIYRGALQNKRYLKQYFIDIFGERDGISIDDIDLNEVDWQEIRESLEE
jgi:hypothetical protein